MTSQPTPTIVLDHLAQTRAAEHTDKLDLAQENIVRASGWYRLEAPTTDGFTHVYMRWDRGRLTAPWVGRLLRPLGESEIEEIEMLDDEDRAAHLAELGLTVYRDDATYRWYAVTDDDLADLGKLLADDSTEDAIMLTVNDQDKPVIKLNPTLRNERRTLGEYLPVHSFDVVDCFVEMLERHGFGEPEPVELFRRCYRHSGDALAEHPVKQFNSVLARIVEAYKGLHAALSSDLILTWEVTADGDLVTLAWYESERRRIELVATPSKEWRIDLVTTHPIDDC